MALSQPPPQIAIAYVWNDNGMATWCYEAAHALAEAGQEVLLVCSDDAQLPQGISVPLLRFGSGYVSPKRLLQKLKHEIHRVVPGESTLLRQLDTRLAAEGRSPRVYLLNSSEFFDPTVKIPQAVVGWGYPTGIAGYLGKIGTYGGLRPSVSGIRAAMDQIGWYFKDWRAYRGANRTLAVSQRMHADLQKSGVRSVVVHPGTQVRTIDETPAEPTTAEPRLLIAAADLDDPRKRVGWMLAALGAAPVRNYRLTLVGRFSPALKALADSHKLPCNFTGRLPRDRVQALMREQDLFLFGSRLDDWGYVLIEAMAAGLAVVAANLSPFDEIVGSAGSLYQWNSQGAFNDSVTSLFDDNLPAKKRAAHERAERLFSRPAFARSLMVAIAP